MNFRTDNIQTETVLKARQLGATVKVLSNVGGGFPDLLMGFKGINWIFELKSKKGILTPKQVRFLEAWNGSAYVARSADEVIDILRSI
jgi:hypothetical protein